MSKVNTYFGTEYSEIVQNGQLVQTKKIPIGEVKFWKQHQSMSDLTPEVFGCESGDNASDSRSPQFIVKLSGKRPDGKYSSVEYLDSGHNMKTDDMLERFSLTPETTFNYVDGSIGCRGGGGKIEDYKEGFRKGYRQVKSGDQNTIQLTLYRPFTKVGKNEYEELIIEDLDKKSFKKLAWQVEQEVWEIPARYLNCENRELKAKEVYLYPDCFNLNPRVIAEFMSKRYSQVGKFNVQVEDEVETIENIPVYFRALDKNNNAISDLRDIPKYRDELFEVKGKYFHLRYHFRLSKKWDRLKHGMWNKKVNNDKGIENRELIKQLGLKSEQPLLQIFDKNDIWLHTGARSNFWSTWKNNRHQSLELFVCFTNDISDKTSLIKSRGFSDDDFEKALVEKVLDIVQNDEVTFRTPHHFKITQNERPEVDQFIKNIMNDRALQLSFMMLNKNWTMDRLSKKSNWRNSSVLGKPAREVDCRFVPKDIPKVWFEFQSSPADYTHLDGINSRAIMLNAQENEYDTIVWVAKSFDGKQESLEEMWLKVDWGNTNLSKVHLITTAQLGLELNKQGGFGPDEIITIDVEEIIKAQQKGGQNG
jgi:hypothetical protein